MTTSGERPLLAGIDVGGSKIAVLLVDRSGAVRGRLEVPAAVGAPEHAADRIAAALHEALGRVAAGIDDVAAVGVGVPGRVDGATGVVSFAVNLGWRDLPLGELLAARLGVPCRIENDVRAAAAGMVERGVLGDVADFVYLSIGTGISAGVVLGGRVHRGVRGLAGEVGHIVVEPSGDVCACGLRGCLETVAAGPAIARRAAAALATDGATSRLAGTPDPAEVYRAAAAGDPLAERIVAHAGRALARAIHVLAMGYDVDRIVLGGGVTRAGETFLEPILAALAGMRAESPLAAEMLPARAVGLAPDGTEAGAWGAVSVARALAAAPTGATAAAEEVIARPLGT